MKIMKRSKEIVSILVLILLDRFTKYLIETHMLLGQEIVLIPGFFSLTYVRNTGAGFSLLEGQRVFFIVITIAALALFGVLWYRCKEEDRWEKVSYVLILAGTIGNFIDRVATGSVVDFLDFLIFGYDFPVFNAADICLTVGAGLFLLLSLRGGEKHA